MSVVVEDFGPILSLLIGEWEGDNGVDLAPHPQDNIEKNPFYETIVFSPLGTYVQNAKKQNLAALFYHHRVYKKINDEEFHNQCGYWMWDSEQNLLIHSLQIPRAMGLIAGGTYEGETDKDGNLIFEVKSGLSAPEWEMAQAPFLKDNAETTDFIYRGKINKDTLSYTQTMILNIYDQPDFKHVDRSTLTRKK